MNGLQEMRLKESDIRHSLACKPRKMDFFFLRALLKLLKVFHVGSGKIQFTFWIDHIEM